MPIHSSSVVNVTTGAPTVPLVALQTGALAGLMPAGFKFGNISVRMKNFEHFASREFKTRCVKLEADAHFVDFVKEMDLLHFLHMSLQSDLMVTVVAVH